MSWIESASQVFSSWRESAKAKIRKAWASIYAEALREFVIVLLLSNLPFGAIILSHYIGTPNAPLSLEDVAAVIASNWKPGEILILVSALLAPFSYLLSLYHRARRHMPMYTTLSILVLVMYLSASYIFAYDRMQAIKNEGFIRTSSLLLYVGAIVIWYIGLVFERRLIRPPADEGSMRADKMAAQLQEGGQ
ncbi:MAG: hypothetical protein HKL84_09470 [Acidimicrobiaceae bacterium]|nr:hypothetical protein [Acidimicrobiaceae bacterium]